MSISWAGAREFVRYWHACMAPLVLARTGSGVTGRPIYSHRILTIRKQRSGAKPYSDQLLQDAHVELTSRVIEFGSPAAIPKKRNPGTNAGECGYMDSFASVRFSKTPTNRVTGNATKKYIAAATVNISTGRPVCIDMLWLTNIRSDIPTADTSALSLKRLVQFDRSVGAERSNAWGKTT